MRRLVMPLIGGTGPDDSLRVDLPTYQIIEMRADGRSAVVVVPDADFPEDAAWDALPLGAGGERDPGRLSRVALDRWHEHLDERYAEHAGRFRPGRTDTGRVVPRG